MARRELARGPSDASAIRSEVDQGVKGVLDGKTYQAVAQALGLRPLCRRAARVGTCPRATEGRRGGIHRRGRGAYGGNHARTQGLLPGSTRHQALGTSSMLSCPALAAAALP